jgi:hypothetical protein
MMHTDQILTRSNAMRVGIVLSVMALPFVAYSHSGNTEPATGATSAPSAVALASPTSKIIPNNPEIDAARRDLCGEQTWPYLSKDCLRGKGRALQPRQIAITGEAVAASGAANDQILIAAAATPAKHKASHIEHHKRVRRNVVAARNVQARETFAQAAPYEGIDSWRPDW